MGSRTSKISAPSPAPGFDFTGRMWQLCHDATHRVPALQHIDMSRVAVSFCQTRRKVLHGLQAKLTPLRFRDGQRQERRRGRMWTVERVLDAQGQEMLYILSFYLPRFLQQPPAEKLTTIFHELWHISPQFDGDLRRFPGRCYAHSHSQREFDEVATQVAKEWMAARPDSDLYDFLWLSFDQLQRLHGRIFGVKLRAPRLIPAE